MTKEEVRKVFQKKREAMTEDSWWEKNAAISSLLLTSLPLQKIGVVHTYLPVEEKNEIDTWTFIDRMQKFRPDIRISIPKVAGENLEHYYFEDRFQLKKNRWGILEPEKGEQTPVQKIDIVIVPLLAFDENLHRVGYGKGYYDKFLKTCRKDCLFIGLSYFPPIDKIDDLHKGDIALHHVITPNKVY